MFTSQVFLACNSLTKSVRSSGCNLKVLISDSQNSVIALIIPAARVLVCVDSWSSDFGFLLMVLSIVAVLELDGRLCDRLFGPVDGVVFFSALLVIG